jgi:hypothetical protein
MAVKIPEEVSMDVEELAADGVAESGPEDCHRVEHTQVERGGIRTHALVDISHA